MDEAFNRRELRVLIESRLASLPIELCAVEGALHADLAVIVSMGSGFVRCSLCDMPCAVTVHLVRWT